MTTDELRQARQEWAHAQMDLDTRLTRFIPAALAADAHGGEELQRLLTPEQTHEISQLYGNVVALWVRYRVLLQHLDEAAQAAD
ncbi:MAG: hypothetical protein QOJ79_310 [Actinomycetota bacterium]|jgi:hypothetical protein|nr:hypothetical protein [Actinomycetota bacterium]